MKKIDRKKREAVCFLYILKDVCRESGHPGNAGQQNGRSWETIAKCESKTKET
jgi:hypothetical protein